MQKNIGFDSAILGENQILVDGHIPEQPSRLYIYLS